MHCPAFMLISYPSGSASLSSMLDDFSHELESTQSRLDNVMKKLAKVSHMTSDRRQWCAIAVLFVVLLVVLVFFLVL